MTVTLTLPQNSVSEGPSHRIHRALPNALNTSIANDRYARNRHVEAVRRFAERLSGAIDENKLKVASGATARHPGTVIMNTGIRIQSKPGQPTSSLQIKFDLARNSISLISVGRAIDFDVRRSAPRAMMKLAKIEETLREENERGQSAKKALDTKVLSGTFHQAMAPALRVSPVKLADGGYEFQIEAPAEMTRNDGSQLQITGTVTIQTDRQGRPTRFMSAVSTDDRVLAGSKRCSGPHTTYISERGIQDTLRGALRGMFPREYQKMSSR